MAKKSVMFLINGLGVEKPGSYSIAIDQAMPRLARIMETSFYKTAVINALEYRGAYQQFYLGDTYGSEVNYIKEHVINEKLTSHPMFQSLQTSVNNENKLHIFLEPTNNQVVELINTLVNNLTLPEKKEVYLHLILSQLTVSDYKELINIVNYIKYHINTHITVGFIIGKDYFSENPSPEETKFAKKLLFYCSAERWIDTDKKLLSLQESNVRPCAAPGFCATNQCTINNNDTIMFFNTRKDDYDKFINAILVNAPEVYNDPNFSLPIYSLIKLNSKYDIPAFLDNVEYKNNFASLLKKAGKKALIVTSEKNISLVNLLANGLNNINNPDIQFMKLNDTYYNDMNNIIGLIDNSEFDFIIFDYHLDVSKTVNDLKEQMSKIDLVLGNVATVCENKHTLIITSLYGLKKTLPLAQYNTEMVTIDYELQIPIFLFDYSYPRGKYRLAGGSTNDILNTALTCIWPNNELYSLIRPKDLIANLFGKK